MIKYAPTSEKIRITAGSISLTCWQLQKTMPKAAIVIGKGHGAASAPFKASCHVDYFCPADQALLSRVSILMTSREYLPLFRSDDNQTDYQLTGFEPDWISQCGSDIKQRLYRMPFVYRDVPLLVFVEASDADVCFSHVIECLIERFDVDSVSGYFSRAGDRSVEYVPSILRKQGFSRSMMTPF